MKPGLLQPTLVRLSDDAAMTIRELTRAVKVVHRVHGPWPSLQAEEVPAGYGAQVGQEGLVVAGGRDEGGAVGDPHDQGGEHGVEGAVVADLIGLAPGRAGERLLPGSDAVFATFGPLDARMQARMPAFQSYFEYMMSFTDPSKLAPGSWRAAIWDAVDDGRIGPESAFPLLTCGCRKPMPPGDIRG